MTDLYVHFEEVPQMFNGGNPIQFIELYMPNALLKTAQTLQESEITQVFSNLSFDLIGEI